MKPSELGASLDLLVRRFRPDLAWKEGLHAFRDAALAPEVRREARKILRKLAKDSLPMSFWTDEHRAEADEAGAIIGDKPRRIGRVAFPVVVDRGGHSFFAEIVASRAPESAKRVGLQGLDESAVGAIAAGEAEARRLTGDRDPIHFRIEAPEDVRTIAGPSCGLAAALAAVSLIEGVVVEDSIVATGQVRHDAVGDVDGLAEKARLRREARPCARLFVPTGAWEDDAELVPVGSLEDARRRLAEPDERARAEAVRQYVASLSQDPSLRRMNLQGLHGVRRGPHSTDLDVLDLVVPPTFDGEDAAQSHHDRLAEVLAEDIRPDRPDVEAVERKYRAAEYLAHSGWSRRQEIALDALLQTPKLAIVGEAGMGKSTVVRLVALACCENSAGARARAIIATNDGGARLSHLRRLIPLRLSFARLAERLEADSEHALPDLVRAELRDQGASVALTRAIDEALVGGRCLLLLDGLDEAPESLRERTAGLIEAFVAKTPECRLIVTSRPHGYRPRIAGLVQVHIRPYDAEQKFELVVRMLRATSRSRAVGTLGAHSAEVSTRARAILQAISADKKLVELTSNPLLLGLVALLPHGTEASHRVVVYENFVRTLSETWSRHRQANSRGRGALPADRILSAWSEVARISVCEERRHGIKRGRCLRILAGALRESGPTEGCDDAAVAVLERGLEDGLIREIDGTIAFAHSSYGEFLAALTLTNRVSGAARRILDEVASRKLSPLVVQLAAARLAVVEEAHDEVELLIDGLLGADEPAIPGIDASGLGLASMIVADRVPMSTPVRDRILERWLRLAERGSSSLHGEGFAEVLAVLDEGRLSFEQLERVLCLIHDQPREVRQQIMRLASTGTMRSSVAQQVCRRRLERFAGSSEGAEIHFAALGLARVGEWSDDVLRALATYAQHEQPPFATTSIVVKSMPAAAVAKFEDQVRAMEAKLAQSDRWDEWRRDQSSTEAVFLLALRPTVPSAIVRLLAEAHGDDAKALLRVLCLRDRSAIGALGELLKDARLCSGLLEGVLVDAAIQSEASLPLVVETLRNVPRGQQKDAWRTMQRVFVQLPSAEELLRRQLDDSDEGRRCIAAALLFQAVPADEAVVHALLQGCSSAQAVSRTLCADTVLDASSQEVGHELLNAAMRVALEVNTDSSDHIFQGSSVSWWPPERQKALVECLADRAAPGALRAAAAEHLVPDTLAEPGTVASVRELLNCGDAKVSARAATLLYERGLCDESIVGELVYVIEGGSRSAREHRPWFRGEVPLEELPRLAVRVLARAAEIELSTFHHEKFRFREFAVELVSKTIERVPAFVEDVLRVFEATSPAANLVESVLHRAREFPGVSEGMLTASERPGLSSVACLRYCRFFSWHSRPHPPALQGLWLYLRSPESGLDAGERATAARLLAHCGCLREAALIWCQLLDTEYVLHSAEALIERFGRNARPWIEAAVERMLASAKAAGSWTIQRRLRLARVALGMDLGRAQAVELTLGVLSEPRDATNVLQLGHPYLAFDAAEPEEASSLREIAGHLPGDSHGFALSLLLRHAPEESTPVFLEWLGNRDRFTIAVECLRQLGLHTEEVMATLRKRAAADGYSERELAVRLLEEMQAIDTQVLDSAILRLMNDSDTGDAHQVTRWLVRWARWLPGVTSAIRKHLPGEFGNSQWEISKILCQMGPVDADALELLLDLAMQPPRVNYVGNVCAAWDKASAPWLAGGSFRQELCRRFEARWQPEDTDGVLDHDEIARVLGVDAALRVPRLRPLLDPSDPRTALHAALALADLGVFDADVEAVVWALIEAPIPSESTDRATDPSVGPNALRIQDRIAAGGAILANRGESVRLARAMDEVADAHGLSLGSRRWVVYQLQSASVWSGATAAWVEKHLAAASIEDFIDHGVKFIEGIEVPLTLRVRTFVASICGHGHGNSGAYDAFEALTALISAHDQSAPLQEGDAEKLEEYRRRELREPEGRKAFFGWAEVLASIAALDELLWSLGELPVPLLGTYRDALGGHVARDRAEIFEALSRRQTADPTGGSAQDRVVNFAREWLTYRLVASDARAVAS